MSEKPSSAQSSDVTFYFDCGCPYAWITSRWIKEVEANSSIHVTWIPMSLAVLNDGRDLDEQYKAHIEPLWRSARLFAKVATDHPEALDALYTAVGTRLFPQGRRDDGDIDAVLTEAIEEVGLDGRLTETFSDSSLDEVAASFHNRAMDLVGSDVGTPVIQVGDGAGFFGPVLTRIPRGKEAVELFRAASVLGGYPHFFELKRSRTESYDFS